MWMSLVAMKVWMRGRSESLIAFHAASMSALERARQAADHRAVDLARDGLHRLEVTGRGDREAGLDHVHPQAGELVRDLHLLRAVERDARRLLAVAKRRIEDPYSVLLAASVAHVIALFFVLPVFPLSLRLAAATRYSPRGGRRRRRRRRERRDIAEKPSASARRRGAQPDRRSGEHRSHVITARGPPCRCSRGRAGSGGRRGPARAGRPAPPPAAAGRRRSRPAAGRRTPPATPWRPTA